MENITITYQSEHGTVPAAKKVSADGVSTWYLPNFGYIPSPRIIARGLNDGLNDNETCDYMPYMLVRNEADQLNYIIAFDYENVKAGIFKVVDFSDYTYGIYVQSPCSVRWNMASAEWFLEERPTFEEVTSLILPVKCSHTSETGVYYMTIGNEDGQIGMTNYPDYPARWRIFWASAFAKQTIPGLSNLNIKWETPEPLDYDCYFLNAIADLPTLEADGYTFKGWYLNGELVEGNYPINSDVTLTAMWEANAPATVDYTITYVTAHGTAPNAKTVTVNEGESYVLTAADLPTLKINYNYGYAFTGWTADGATILSVGDTISADTVLTAVWRDNPFVFYDTDIGTAPANKFVTANEDGSYTFTEADLPTLEADGYIFNGWLLNGSLVSVGDTIIFSSLQITLYASWVSATKTLVITYVTAHGTAPEAKTVTVNEDGSYTLTKADLPAITAEGYIFNGWVINGKGMAKVGDTISADTVLYASWNEATEDYVISYSTEHGTKPANKTVTVDYGESYALTAADLPTLEAEGYIFGGWLLDGVPVNVGDTINDNSTLVAVWSEDIVSTFNKAWAMLGYVIGTRLRDMR